MEEELLYAKSKWAEILGVSTPSYYTWFQERNIRVSRKDQLRPDVIRILGMVNGVMVQRGSAVFSEGKVKKASFKVVSSIMKKEGLRSKHTAGASAH